MCHGCTDFISNPFSQCFRSCKHEALTLSGPLARDLLDVAHCPCLTERSGRFFELELLGKDRNGSLLDNSRSEELYRTGQDSLRHLPQ